MSARPERELRLAIPGREDDLCLRAWIAAHLQPRRILLEPARRTQMEQLLEAPGGTIR